MIETLIKNISPEVYSAVTEKFSLNEEMGNKAVDATKHSLKETVSNEIKEGNLDGLLSMFNGGENATENPVFQRLAGKLSGDYIQKLGISPTVASQISHFVLPLVVSKISSMLGGKVDKESLGDILAQRGLIDKAGDVLSGLGNLFKK